MRIALAGIIWEALTFSPVPSTPEDYAYYRGDDFVRQYQLDEIAKELEIEIIPILSAECKSPGGNSSKDAYFAIREEILAGIRAAGTIDGVCLILHGSNEVADFGSAEEDLVLAVRELVGPEMLIAARYDQHANITMPQAEALNIITILRTAPHRDYVSRAHDALRLLVPAIRKGWQPRSTYIRIPMLIMGEKSTNVTEPMRSLIPLAVQASGEPGILNADISAGFAWGDLEISGMGVAVTAASAADLPKAIEVRDRIAREVWKRRDDFQICGEYAPDIDSAIQRALAAPESSVFMSDVGDNMTAGAPGDTTCFLEKLLEYQVPDAVVAGITDREATQACFEAGEGATLTLTIGGKLDTVNSRPLTITGQVTYLFTPAVERGSRMATLKVKGVTLVLTEERWPFIWRHQFSEAGIDPLAHKMVVVKTGYLHPEIIDIAPRAFMVITPGFTTLDLKQLPWRRVIRPIYPLDEFDWDPVQASS